MTLPAHPDNAGPTGSCDSSEVVTQLLELKGDFDPTEYECFRLTEAEAAELLFKEH